MIFATIVFWFVREGGGREKLVLAASSRSAFYILHLLVFCRHVISDQILCYNLQTKYSLIKYHIGAGGCNQGEVLDYTEVIWLRYVRPRRQAVRGDDRPMATRL